MARRQPWTVTYDPEVHQHLRWIEPKHRASIRTTIEEQLSHEPLGLTRNRKALKRPTAFGATWELRFGPNNRFRVFYRVEPAEGRVRILAIGVKDRDRVSIGGEEVEL